MSSILNSIYSSYANTPDGVIEKLAMMPMPGGMPLDPAAGGMPPGAPPMDPAAMGGMPPMDPAAAGGMPPPDPAAAMGSLGGGGPLDPASLASMPGATPPPEGGESAFSEEQKKYLEELVTKVTQSALGGPGGAGAAGAGGKKNVEAKIDELTGLIKALMAYNAGKEGKPPDSVPELQQLGGQDGGATPPETKLAFARDATPAGVRATDDYAMMVTGTPAQLGQVMQDLGRRYQVRHNGHASL